MPGKRRKSRVAAAVPVQAEPQGSESWLELKNPHSVRAAMASRPEQVKELMFTGEPQGLWKRLAEEAEQQGIPVRLLEPAEQPRQRAHERKQERVGHALARVAAKPSVSLEELWSDVAQPNADGTPGLWLALDSLQDPHNVGAIFRTAGFFGARGIVVTKNASAPINATVYDVAAGALETVPHAVVSNLNRALKLSRRIGLWNLGSSEHAEQSVWEVDRQLPWLIVVGNEQKGLRHLVLEHCDRICRVPPLGEVKSLNVSVATGILLATLTRPEK